VYLLRYHARDRLHQLGVGHRLLIVRG
jgi:hypothetical protein